MVEVVGPLHAGRVDGAQSNGRLQRPATLHWDLTVRLRPGAPLARSNAHTQQEKTAHLQSMGVATSRAWRRGAIARRDRGRGL